MAIGDETHAGRAWPPGRRQEALWRDRWACQKCGYCAPDGADLEVHHKVEVSQGGGHELANLVTLCSDCHAEWTFCQPPDIDFLTWQNLPPARWLVALVANPEMPWPSRDQLIVSFQLYSVSRAEEADWTPIADLYTPRRRRTKAKR